MALIEGTKENYTHVEFKAYKGTYGFSKELYLKWKGETKDIKYFIVNNE